ncbi:MAG: hypothetical protein M3R44_02770 [Candidatus Eremiobacteraeota bacterium]|nr:hypothetical protein [Candidatus Eremiobacteraeota bacterium]
MSVNIRAALLDARVRFGIVLAVALGVRLFALGTNPVEVHADELAGLVGVSNILHGRAPLVPFFDLRIEYLPLYGIFETLSTSLLGVSPFAMRLPAALLGVVSVVALRRLVLELTSPRAGARAASPLGLRVASSFDEGAEGIAPAGRPILADGAAAIFAILPWAIHLSRLGLENAAVFPFLLGGLAALARGLRLRERSPLLLAGVLLGIGAYSYRAEPIDALLLAGALLISRPHDRRALVRPLLLAAGISAALVTPLAAGVATHQHFFWRDANIATFGHGYTSAAFGTFVHNYVAHFAVGPLFAYGDGILDHGPHYGELYWWMLPFLLGGLFTAAGIVGRANALFFFVWLAIYPLGGALTNDGVPDFARTMIGAPLACIMTAIGLRAVWLRVNAFSKPARLGASRAPLRAFVAVAFAGVIAFAFADFDRVYFAAYPAAAADQFKYGTADLFARVRALGTGDRRVCFASLDWYNYDTYVDFYMAGSPLVPIEGLPAACAGPRSLIVVDAPSKAPADSKLIGVQQTYEGGIMAYIYQT